MNRLLSAEAGRKVTLKLEPGVVEGPVRTSPESPDRGDWTLLLRKREE